MLFYAFFYNIIKVSHFLHRFIILLHLIYFFSFTRSLLVPYAYWIDCVLLSSFELNTILLISSVTTLIVSLLNFCCVGNIDLLLLMKCFKTIFVNFIFFKVTYFLVKYQILFQHLLQCLFKYHLLLCIQWNYLYPYNTISLFHHILVLHNHTKTQTLYFT